MVGNYITGCEQRGTSFKWDIRALQGPIGFLNSAIQRVVRYWGFHKKGSHGKDT